MIRVAQAGSDERYKYKNGEAGDQRKGTPDANGCFTGELNVEPWYNKPWDYVIRAKDPAVAETIAQAIYLICLNKKVGYDQNQAETLWDAINKLGWNLLAIPNLPLCECDCCRLVDVGVRFAGITNIPNLKHLYTGNVKDALINSGHFELLTDTKYTQSPDNLKRGDLLLQECHHICVVLDDAVKEIGVPYRVYKCLSCYQRTAANTGGKVINTLHHNDIVMLYGWSPNNWGLVSVNGTTGYVSGKFLTPAKEVQTTGKVWLRSGAGTQNNALVAIPNNTVLPWGGVSAKSGSTTWYYLNYGGYNGYASGKYVKVVK